MTAEAGAAQPHEFDASVHLVRQGQGLYRGETRPSYGNMVGPFGGITAATLLNAACLDPQRLGEPVSLTVNYAGPVAEGEFLVAARPVRTNRSTQHWSIELSQAGVIATTATAVFAIRRDTWAAAEAVPPDAPPASSLPVVPVVRGPIAWVRNYDFRFVQGAFPDHTNPPLLDDSTSTVWVRDEPPRPLDALSLAALCDVFFPRIYLRQSKRSPAGTVSLTVYFHSDAAAYVRQGAQPVLATARAKRFHGGFFDQAAEIWGEDGALLASSHQLVYFRG